MIRAFIVKIKIIIAIMFAFRFINEIMSVDRARNLINNKKIYDYVIIVNVTIN